MTENVKVKVNGTKLIVEVELDGTEGNVSSTGKTKLFASTQEKVTIGGKKMTLGLNLYEKIA